MGFLWVFGSCVRLVQLRTWDAYKELKRKIEGFQQKLPLFASLSKPSIRDRHWSLIQDATGTQLRPFDPDFCLGHLLDIDVSSTLMDIEEVADGAEKELAIETKLSEMEDKWKNERFRFVEWRGRGVPILVGIPVVLEDLEEVTQKTTPTVSNTMRVWCVGTAAAVWRAPCSGAAAPV